MRGDPIEPIRGLLRLLVPFFANQSLNAEAEIASTGYPPPWPQVTRRLLGRRLLVSTGDRAADGAARVVRMHRLVQELVQGRAVQGRTEVELKQRHDALVAHAFERSEELEQHWHEPDHQWEIAPLLAFLNQLLDDSDSEAPRLVKWVSQWLGHFDNSMRNELLLKRTLAQQEADIHTEPGEIAITLSNLGHVLTEQGRFAEAEPLLRKALAIDVKYREPTHEFIAIRLHNLANLLEAMNRMEEAELLYRRAQAINEECFGTDHPTAAPILHGLAGLLKDTNRLGEAELLTRRVLAIWEKSLAADHPHFASSLNALANLLLAMDRLKEAEPLYRRALAIWEKSFGADHHNVAIVLNNLAHLLQATDQLAEAELLYRRALAIDEQSYGATHHIISHRLNNLCTALIMQGRLGEAKPLVTRAWLLKSGQHDITSSRLLFVREAIALLEYRHTEEFVGQLKTLLEAASLPDYAGVAKVWDVAPVIEHLRPQLPVGSTDFLTALAAALNDRSQLPDLHRFPEWRNQVPIPLDTPWPSA